MIDKVHALGARFELQTACFGHAGDGNLHVNLLVDDERDMAKIDDAIGALFRDALSLRGTLSGEHGIGLAKMDYMPLEQSAEVLEWQRRWKLMWDPDDLLNPGKILPERPRGCSE